MTTMNTERRQQWNEELTRARADLETEQAQVKLGNQRIRNLRSLIQTLENIIQE